MRRLVLTAAALLLTGTALWAQQAPAPAPAALAPDPQIDALQQRLLASQQTIATLERELADAKGKVAVLDQCRVKNGRLVSIGRQLVESYERRYRDDHHHAPLQLGRQRFEFELQALGDTVYDASVNLPIQLPPEVQPKPAEPVKPAKALKSK